jgi:uncharacterized protein with GYD domain
MYRTLRQYDIVAIFDVADLGGRDLSRTRSSITLCSNSANESSTLRVSRLMLEVVLKDW